MEQVFNLSYAGNVKGLREYLEIFDCKHCEDKGYFEKTEWVGTDDSYDITVICECSLD